MLWGEAMAEFSAVVDALVEAGHMMGLGSISLVSSRAKEISEATAEPLAVDDGTGLPMHQFVREVWLVEKDEFIFRVRSNDTKTQWTFRVPQGTLATLHPERGMSPHEIFDLHRPQIYAAANHIIASRDSARQQVISPGDIAEVANSSRR
jgi:hypothetical protein